MGSKNDSSFFILHIGNHTLIMLIYVDDIILTRSHQLDIDHLIHSLRQQFAIKDLDPLHYFLGVEIVKSGQCLYLSQRKYVRDPLLRSNMDGAKPCRTPIVCKNHLSKHSSTPLSDGTEYRSIVGALQYLSLTRPDISFAVNKVCQFMHCPTTDH